MSKGERVIFSFGTTQQLLSAIRRTFPKSPTKLASDTESIRRKKNKRSLYKQMKARKR